MEMHGNARVQDPETAGTEIEANAAARCLFPAAHLHAKAVFPQNDFETCIFLRIMLQ